MSTILSQAQCFPYLIHVPRSRWSLQKRSYPWADTMLWHVRCKQNVWHVMGWWVFTNELVNFVNFWIGQFRECLNGSFSKQTCQFGLNGYFLLSLDCQEWPMKYLIEHVEPGSCFLTSYIFTWQCLSADVIIMIINPLLWLFAITEDIRPLVASSSIIL